MKINVCSDAETMTIADTDYFIPLVKVVLRRRGLFRWRHIEVVVDGENGQVWGLEWTELGSLFAASEKKIEILETLRKEARSQFDIRNRLNLTGSWTSRLVDSMLREGLLRSTVEGTATLFEWGKRIRDLQSFKGYKISTSNESLQVDRKRAIPYRYSPGHVGRILAVVLNGTVCKTQILYKPCMCVSRHGHQLTLANRISDHQRRLIFLPVKGQGNEAKTKVMMDASTDRAFCGMGNEKGWESWTGNAHSHFLTMGSESVHLKYCPKKKFQHHIRTPETRLYYHLCHGGSTGFTAGDGTIISAPNIAEWMETRPHMRFAFIGSCAGMERTGVGSLCSGFSKNIEHQCAVVGYVRMGEPGSGWPYSLAWQNTLFRLAMEQGVPIYEALLRAQSHIPQMSRNWGFWGNRSLVIKVRTIENVPAFRGVMMEWKRAKGKRMLANNVELDRVAKDLMSHQCPAVANEMFEASRQLVAEDDTGNLRLQIRFDRRVNGILVIGDFVTMDLDPRDGEILFFKNQTQSSLQELSADVPVLPAQAASTAETEAERLLREQKIAFRQGSVRFQAPELVFTSTMPIIDTNRFMAYRILTVFTRPSGEESHSYLLVNAETGKAVSLTPPPP